MKILDFDLEGSHFIMEAEVSKRQKTDDDDDDMAPSGPIPPDLGGIKNISPAPVSPHP